METRVVKLFKNGASQAVRLPAEFRFEGEEVYATRDAATGDVVLSPPRQEGLGRFFRACAFGGRRGRVHERTTAQHAAVGAWPLR